MRLQIFLDRLGADSSGTMAIETAIVAPILVLMSLGSFQVSTIVARQTELESAAAEGSAIALASAPDNPAKRTTLQQVIMTSTNLAATQVTVSEVYRCNSATTYLTASTSCTTGVLSKYIKLYITDTYTPSWTRYGVGSPINFRVTRYVMYKQSTL